MSKVKCNEIASVVFAPYDKMFEQSRRVYGTNSVSPTMHTQGGGGQEIKILVLYEL